jgi:hypothetical protein
MASHTGLLQKRSSQIPKFDRSLEYFGPPGAISPHPIEASYVKRREPDLKDGSVISSLEIGMMMLMMMMRMMRMMRMMIRRMN